jgi:hypothetical protein
MAELGFRQAIGTLLALDLLQQISTAGILDLALQHGPAPFVALADDQTARQRPSSGQPPGLQWPVAGDARPAPAQ